jgi:tetrahydromethanopterin S-methyltransferase subunit B
MERQASARVTRILTIAAGGVLIGLAVIGATALILIAAFLSQYGAV